MAKTNEPLIHITKRSNITSKKALGIRVASVVCGILLMCLFCALVSGKSPFLVLTSLFSGAVGTERKIWILLQDTALLLIVSLALVPAFKMKFWNLGGNGQIFIACIASVACMKFLNGAVPEFLAIIIM